MQYTIGMEQLPNPHPRLIETFTKGFTTYTIVETPYYQEAFEEDRKVYQIRHGTRLVSQMRITFDNNEGIYSIEEIDTYPGYQREGFASRLVNLAVRKARTIEGIRRVYACSTSEESMNLFIQCGFVCTHYVDETGYDTWDCYYTL